MDGLSSRPAPSTANGLCNVQFLESEVEAEASRRW